MGTETFTIEERMNLLQALPVKDDFTVLKVARQLKEELSLSDEEAEAVHLAKPGEIDHEGRMVPPGVLRWNPDATADKEIEVGFAARKVIHDALVGLNEQKAGWDALVPLWERFVEED